MTKNLHQLGAEAESHYLVYFMNNLALEATTFFELLGEERQQRLLSDNASLEAVISSILDAMGAMEQWMDPDDAALEERIKLLLRIREQLSQQVAVLAGYDDQLKIMRYRLERTTERPGIMGQTDDETMAGALINYIFEYEDVMTINDRLKSVYGELPVRISRLKFREWIERALLAMQGVSKRDLVNYSTYLKETFHPEGIDGYGEVAVGFYKEVSALMAELMKEDPASETSISRVTALQGVLEDAVSLYTFTASVVNNLLGVLQCLSKESLVENDEEKKAFLDLMGRLYERRNEEIIIDSAMVSVFDGITLRFGSIMERNGFFDSAIEEAKTGRLEEIVKEGLSARYDRLSSLYLLQSNSYFAPLTYASEDMEPVDETVLMSLCKELQAYFEEVTRKEPRWLKRSRMANLFSVLNVIHSTPQEIHGYLLESLSSCKNSLEKEGTLVMLEQLMEE